MIVLLDCLDVGCLSCWNILKIVCFAWLSCQLSPWLIHPYWDLLDMVVFYSMRSSFLLLISFNFMDCGWSYMHVKLLGRDCMKVGLVSCMPLDRGWKWCMVHCDWLDYVFVFCYLNECDRLIHVHMIILFHLNVTPLKTWRIGMRSLGLHASLLPPPSFGPIACFNCFPVHSIFYSCTPFIPLILF